MVPWFRFCFGHQQEKPRDDGVLIEPTNKRMAEFVPPVRVVSKSQCRLLLCCWDCNWPEVILRCESHPEEAYCVTDNSFRSALHLASFSMGCPLNVAMALLNANPHSLMLMDRQGLTPLHCACAFRQSNQLIPLYCMEIQELEDYMGSSLPPIQNDVTPLFLACRRNAPEKTIRVLLDMRSRNCSYWVAPKIGGEPYWITGKISSDATTSSPLHALMKTPKTFSVMEEDYPAFRSLILEYFPLSDQTPSLGDKEEPKNSLNGGNFCPESWRKILVLLQEARYGYEGGILHYVCSLGIPTPSLVSLLCDSCLDHGATVRDSLGLVPLHHLLYHPSVPKEMLVEVLRTNERAARIPVPDGSLPLALALERGRNWSTGVEEIMLAAPIMLTRLDPVSCLFPFMTAASVDSDLTTIYNLLVAAPDQIKHGIW